MNKLRKIAIIVASVIVVIAVLYIVAGTESSTDEKLVANVAKYLKESKSKNQTDTSKQRILLIGDSMAYTLMHRLGDYCEENGHDLKVVSWVAASTVWYGQCDTLQYFINTYKPTIVFMVIGSNELFVDHVKDRREKYIKAMQEKLSGTKCIWIGPPNWKEDSGINALFEEMIGKRKFYLSKYLKLERRDDGTHPSRVGGAVWMDSIAIWIQTKCKYHFLLNKPTKVRTKEFDATILKPLPTTTDTLKHHKN